MTRRSWSEQVLPTVLRLGKQGRGTGPHRDRSTYQWKGDGCLGLVAMDWRNHRSPWQALYGRSRVLTLLANRSARSQSEGGTHEASQYGHGDG